MKKKGKTFELNYYVHKDSMIKFFFYHDQLTKHDKNHYPKCLHYILNDILHVLTSSTIVI